MELDQNPDILSVRKHLVGHLDMEDCPEGLGGDGAFCRLAVSAEQAIVFVFDSATDCLVASRTWEEDAFRAAFLAHADGVLTDEDLRPEDHVIIDFEDGNKLGLIPDSDLIENYRLLATGAVPDYELHHTVMVLKSV